MGALREVIPHLVDETVFSLLKAIDQGTLRVTFSSSAGVAVDLATEGNGELAGSHMGSGGWRSMFSAERVTDDFADLNEED